VRLAEDDDSDGATVESAGLFGARVTAGAGASRGAAAGAAAGAAGAGAAAARAGAAARKGTAAAEAAAVGAAAAAATPMEVLAPGTSASGGASSTGERVRHIKFGEKLKLDELGPIIVNEAGLERVVPFSAQLLSRHRCF
jgi:hypothetical protein